MRSWLALFVVASCYQPSPPANAPCGPSGACPTGQQCQAGRCTTGTVTLDDAPVVSLDVLSDAAVDAGPVDAPPNNVGCADGEREGFVSESEFPDFAGCAAMWTDPVSLRAAATGAACGDDVAGACAAPADACGAGWTICGLSGLPTELSTRATADQCATAGGASGTAFVMAMSHCTTFSDPCTYDVPMGCTASGACSEPVCCGESCRTTQGCLTFVYPVTAILGDQTNGCGLMAPSIATGVLCCR